MSEQGPARAWAVRVARDSQIEVRLKRHALSVSVDTHHVYTFDLEGRPVGVYHSGRNYRRGLDNRVLEKWSGSGQGLARRRRQWLTTAERAEFFSSLRDTMQGVLGAVTRESRQADAACRMLRTVLEWDFQRLEAERERFQRVYRPVSIMPPDQYLSVVVQMTEGCPWNECTFCDLYRDRCYRIKADAELDAHLEGVRALLGEGMRLRKAVFLADANAVAAPQGRLLEMMARVRTHLPMLPVSREASPRRGVRGSGAAALDGFYSFVDAFTSGRKPAAAFAEMREAGLKRLYLGAETGDEQLLRVLNKPTTPAEMVDTVVRMKKGGLQVGVIFLLGVGGRRFAERHERATLEVLLRMPLGRGDLIYLSPFVTHPALPYARWAEEESVAEMGSDQMDAQEQRLRKGVRSLLARGVRLAPYDLREFLY